MLAKVAVLLAAFVAVNASLHAALINTGSSVSSRQQDDFGNYAFNYGIVDGLGATNSRVEIGDGHGNKKGSYTLADIDGRARRVDYIADSLGFRAAVKTNEPGTALSVPAAAVISSPYAAPVAPAAVGHSVAAVAPVTSVAAPIAVAAPVYAGAPSLITSKVVTADTVGIAGPVGYAVGPIGIAGHAGVHGVSAPIGIAGHAGYAGVHGISAPIGIAGHASVHGVSAPLGYTGHLGYGAGFAKVIY